MTWLHFGFGLVLGVSICYWFMKDRESEYTTDGCLGYLKSKGYYVKLYNVGKGR